MRTVIIPMIIAVVIVELSCEKINGIDGPPFDKSPREYTWTHFTIGDGSYQSSPTGIWGSSSRDVYLVGHAGTFVEGKMWHFDGDQWTDISTVYISAFGDLSGYRFTPYDVYGFGADNVWIVGSVDTLGSNPPPPMNEWPGFVLRYDGSRWTGTRLPNAQPHLSVWGIDQDDVWIGGLMGQMYHFDGSQWKEHNLSDSISVIHIEGRRGDEVYAGGQWFPSGQEQIVYFRWDGITWVREEARYAQDPARQFKVRFTLVDGTLHSVTEETVTRRISRGNWENLVSVPGASFSNVGALGKENIFALGDDVPGELLYHFNGRNWARIDSVRRVDANLGGICIFDDAVFIVSVDFSSEGTPWTKSHVIRGQ